ncbi:hypothetical protein, conserved [Trypanosoma brucei gambiense DAL972]|uniref:Uncharacterized protein n=2 Tax=Trypanosoma brucei TaxID=5691 RepID=C9ZJ27_TRYB9|nr:hypothetical protein, conserved [Trypanosoma brucei gambiense DAL972]RHW74083.1 Ribosome biogenesis protein SLX9 [Trypanosoma brucei equiperdum]CBH09385.1 hypothetical protein, conserved [Trypanosoma brucei gambiense DAL972]|eukprot:XP_011771691.1 hypothetical protein, conserved [Trypanosoma brucei gambiense DAL972]
MVKPRSQGPRRPAVKQADNKSVGDRSKTAVTEKMKPSRLVGGITGAKKERREGKKVSTGKANKVAETSASTVVLKEGGKPSGPSHGTGTNSSRRGKRSPQAQTRRAAARVASRVIESNSRITAATNRMNTAREELALFDQVTQMPAFVADPFTAIDEHLSTAMDFLQPQTPDVGRVKRE